MSTTLPDTRSPIRRPLTFIAVFAIAGLAWLAYDAIATATRSERALHACIVSTQLLEDYVIATRGRWPKSWDDLQATVASSQAGSMYSWPKDRPALEQFVDIDFSARPEILAKTSTQDFSAVKPIGPCYSSYDRHFSFLIDALRRFHQ